MYPFWDGIEHRNTCPYLVLNVFNVASVLVMLKLKCKYGAMLTFPVVTCIRSVLILSLSGRNPECSSVGESSDLLSGVSCVIQTVGWLVVHLGNRCTCGNDSCFNTSRDRC